MTYTRRDFRIPVTGVRTPPRSPARLRFAGLPRSAVALFRLGTYRTRLAAALIIVATSLLYQTGAEALEQSSRKVLYLDAPSVSVPEAEKAATTAGGYAGPDSSVDDAVLAWVDVQPVPGEARDAFASITAPGGQPPGGVSYDAAVAAGDAMVAQIGGEPPVPDGGGDEELASADPVRPTLGDGTKATDAPDPQAGPQSPEPANPANPSDLGLPAPMAQAYTPPNPPANNKKPDTPSGSSDDELAAVPDAPAPEMEAHSKPLHTGPIADDYRQKPTSTKPSARSTDQPTQSDPPADDRAAVSKDTEEEPSASKAPDAIEQKASPIVVVPDSSKTTTDPEYAAAREPSDNQATSQPAPDPTDEPRQSSSPEQEAPYEQQSSPEQTAPSEAETRPSTQEPSGSSDLVAVVPASTETNEGQQEDPAAQPRAAAPDESSGETSTGAPGDETESPAPDTDYRPGPASQTEPTSDAESPENESSPADSASPPQTSEDSTPVPESAETTNPPAKTSEEFPSDSGNSETTEQQISIVVQDNASEANTSTPGEQHQPTDSPEPEQTPADKPSDKSKDLQEGGDDSSEESTSSDPAPEERSDAPKDVSEDPPQGGSDAGGDTDPTDTPAERDEPHETQEPVSAEPAAAPEHTGPAGGSQRSAPNRTAQPPRKGDETRQRTTPRPSERSSPKPGGGTGSNGRGPTQTAGAVQISSQSPSAEAPEIAQDTGTTTSGLQDDSSAAPPTQRQPAAGSARSAPRAVQRAEARAQRRAARQATRRVALTPTPATPSATPAGAAEQPPITPAPTALSDAPIVEPATAVHQAARKQRRAQRIATRPPAVSPGAAAGPDATPAEPTTPAPVQEPTADHYSEDPPVAASQASDLAAEIDSSTQETVAAVEAEPTPPDAAQPDVTPSDSYDEPQAPAAESRLEPVEQVPAQRLEPVQQVPPMPLDTTPPPATAAPESAASEPVASEPAAAPEAVQEVQSTVETAVPDPAGGNQ